MSDPVIPAETIEQTGHLVLGDEAAEYEDATEIEFALLCRLTRSYSARIGWEWDEVLSVVAENMVCPDPVPAAIAGPRSESGRAANLVLASGLALFLALTLVPWIWRIVEVAGQAR